MTPNEDFTSCSRREIRSFSSLSNESVRIKLALSDSAFAH